MINILPNQTLVNLSAGPDLEDIDPIATEYLPVRLRILNSLNCTDLDDAPILYSLYHP